MLPKPDQMNQVIVLLNVYHGRRKPSEISKNMDITLQGVIYHLKNLRKSRYIDEENRITKEGFQFLYDQLSEMREFINENITDLDSVMVWEAIAGSRIEKGDDIFLRMNSGYLYAYHEGPGASGKAENDASEGDLVGVTQISGMIDVSIGVLDIVIIPDSLDETVISKLKGIIEDRKNSEIAAMGEGGFVAARKLGLNPSIEFGSLPASFEACVRGISVILLVSRRRFHYSLREIPELENRYNPVRAHIIDLT
ncbi:transcriptional regulator [Thermoplasma volcanium]|nr:transcriptional regulator [Thermoplasma volcanium]